MLTRYTANGKAEWLEQYTLIYTEMIILISAYHLIYVAAKATYIRLLHGKIGFLGGFSALAP